MNSPTDRAVVTGGAHGIGAAIVRRLAQLGMSVVVLDLDSPEDSAAVRGSITVDLAAAEAVVDAAAQASNLIGGIDVLVNCAGVNLPGGTAELDEERYHRTLAVNLHAPVILMRECARLMRPRGYGRIVNVTSVHGRLSERRSLAYDVSKAGLEAATRSASLDLADSGVLVNAVAPGFVATRMSIVDGIDELDSDPFRTAYVEQGRLPLRRAARADEIAEVVAWLAGPANTYVTGQVITVDGGLSATF